MPWIEGSRLTICDKNEELLRMIAQYIAKSATTSLASDEADSALRRLKYMVKFNLAEALGAEMRVNIERSFADIGVASPPRSYGDGRMAPHEWVRTEDGAILKTDCAGHDSDHTIVGQQSVDWDIAGAIVEWRLNANERTAFIGFCGEAGLPMSQALGFYEIAYAAFRVGFCTLAQSLTGDCAEVARLKDAAGRYSRQLADLMAALR
jgi:hypothetical protein